MLPFLRTAVASRKALLGAVLSLASASQTMTPEPPGPIPPPHHRSVDSPHLEQRKLFELSGRLHDNAAFFQAASHGRRLYLNLFPASAGARIGPNAPSCAECHSNDPAGEDSARRLHRDPPHLSGSGVIQLVAEEMTSDLHAILADARNSACNGALRSPSVSRPLVTHGVDFGTVTVREEWDREHRWKNCRVITRGIVGIDTDLVVRPFQWRGTEATIRGIVRETTERETGLPPVETTNESRSENALSVGDITALTAFVAAQPRPTRKTELAAIGWIPPLNPSEQEAIERGGRTFSAVGCAVCHLPHVSLKDTVFREPSLSASFRDSLFPSGKSPIAAFLDPERATQFDLARMQASGLPLLHDEDGISRIELYGDLKRHDLGPEDADPIDETGKGPSTWLTRSLWGAGSTAPYLHDGRAARFEDAVRFHGGEAAPSRAAYFSLPLESRREVTSFLEDLVLWRRATPTSRDLRAANDARAGSFAPAGGWTCRSGNRTAAYIQIDVMAGEGEGSGKAFQLRQATAPDPSRPPTLSLILDASERRDATDGGWIFSGKTDLNEVELRIESVDGSDQNLPATFTIRGPGRGIRIHRDLACGRTRF